MTDTNEKLRSLFLAALMVFSVFAMTTGFAGSAAAVSNLDAGTFYSGQDVQFDVSNDGNNYQVRTVDDSGDTDQVGSLRRTIDPNDGDIDGTLEFTLDGRLTEGDFVIVNAQSGAVVDLTNGDERVLDSDEGLVASETFEVIPQDLTAEFDDPDVGTSGDSATVDYEIASDVRNGYAVNISAEGLDREELLDILNDDERNAELPENAEIVSSDNPEDIVDANGDNFFDDTEKVQIKQAEGDYVLDFEDITEGNYTFDVEVTDTDANASDTIEVVDTGDASASFQEGVVTENRGDVANITVELANTDEATIQIGDYEDDNYYITAEVEDDDDDGEVSVLFNSYKAGTTSASEVLSVAGDDKINSYEQGGSFTAEGDDTGSDILEATDYDMLVVEGTGVTLPDDDDLITEENELDTDSQIITDEDDVGTLSLEEASLEGVQLWTAPQEKFSDIEDLDDDEAAPVYELVKDGNVTQTDEVAINDVNDVVIVQVQASGLEGLLTTNGDISTAAYGLASEQVDDDDNSGVFSLTFENADPGANQDSPQQDIDQLTNYKVIYDEANDTHFVAVDSSDFESELGAEDEDEYIANFTVYNNGYGDGYSGDAADAGLTGPSDLYDEDDGSVNATDSVQFLDADATLNDDEDITVRAAAGQTISGTTNVAPGSEVTVRLRSSESSSPFLLQPSAIVGPNGTFTATADLSERSPGANFTAQTRVGSAEIGDEYDGQILGAATASVSISDQDSDGTTVVVDSAQLSDGGFIAIHEGSATGDVIGASDYLEAGSHSDIEVTLDTPQDGDFTAVAMPHMDTDGDETYDFPDNDGPYTDNGTAVTDSASVTVAQEETETETETEAPETETETETETATEMPDTPTEEETTTGDSGPGFTAVLALIALVAAALLAVRRNN
ncbi:BGTF surface domain-containing protein [Halomicroarcula sp. GCM10025324]|uniref:DUF7827 domain-containing protein n=1 Tax=Haloarcula TaxID=2237 RepID=UPI0023E789DB|nr:BGTF surface domain-containing protein [Halomicroarcula sp. ZS-22-S1]